MPIISKDTWDKFTQEEKRTIMGMYFTMQQVQQRDNDKESYSQIITYEDLFGKENLQPQPLTYKDVARELFMDKDMWVIDQYENGYNIHSTVPNIGSRLFLNVLNCASQKQAEKLIAINKLLNVAAFLNKGWKPDWNNHQERKWYLTLEDKVTIGYVMGDNSSIVYFRTKELAEQAIQILGEDTVRLALTTEY